MHSGVIDTDREILHFAAEPCVGALMRPFARRYVTADLFDPDADLALNIEDVALPDNSFDVVVCSHVLEHVNDRKALSEIRRILRAGGAAIIAVPIVEGVSTYEDANITSPEDRETHFGQRDHVRIYGSDFRDRLKEAGFGSTEHIASGRPAVDHALYMGDKVFVCRAP